MSVELVLRAITHLTFFTTICLLGTGTIVAGVNAANLRAQPLCSHDGCTVVNAQDLNGLSSPEHIRAVAAVMWKSKV